MTKKIFTILAACTTSVLVMGQTTHTVQVGPGGSSSFSPSSLTINQGDIVDFVQTSSPVAHNVNGSTSTFPSNPASFNSGAPAGGSWTYSFTFNTAGSYQYQCDPHAPGMSGTITVNAPPMPEITFADSAVTYDESAGSVDVYLLIDPVTTMAGSVTIHAIPGPGWYPGIDGTISPTPNPVSFKFNLSFPAGADSVFFTVNIIDDTDVEMDEYVDFAISAAGNVDIGTLRDMRLTIEDNDAPTYDLNISEVMVNSADSTSMTQDWIEIMNYGATAYDLSGFSLAAGGGSTGVNTLPAYTINPGEAIVVWAGDMADEGVFIANWGLGATPPEIISNDEFTAGAFPALSDSNDAVVLYDTTVIAVNICQTDYTTTMPGHSLEFDTACQFTGHAMVAVNGAYMSMGGDVGSPGTMLIGVDAPTYDLDISEVMVRSADSTSITQDWIEIMNYGATAYDLEGFSLANSAGTAGVNTLPAYTINPGEAIVVWAGDMADEGAFIANWSLGATPPEIISNDEFTAGAFPTLGDSNDAVVLYDTSLIAVNICQADYTTTMPGHSLEFDTACQFTGHAMVGMNGAYTSGGGDIGSPGNATISIREQVLESIRLFPNPTTGTVTLELPLAGTKDIRLMDLRGAIVQTERTESEQYHLDLSHLPGGIYLIEVSNGQAHNTLRVVVQ